MAAVALFLSWYALFGGRDTLEQVWPEIVSRGPPPIATVATDSGWQWLTVLVLVAAAVGLTSLRMFAAATRWRSRVVIGPTRWGSHLAKLRPSGSSDEERLWSSHLSWLSDHRLGEVRSNSLASAARAPSTMGAEQPRVTQ